MSAESLWEEPQALDLLGTYLPDGRAGEAFFGDSMRMHRDLPGDAAKDYLPRLLRDNCVCRPKAIRWRQALSHRVPDSLSGGGFRSAQRRLALLSGFGPFQRPPFLGS